MSNVIRLRNLVARNEMISRKFSGGLWKTVKVSVPARVACVVVGVLQTHDDLEKVLGSVHGPDLTQVCNPQIHRYSKHGSVHGPDLTQVCNHRYTDTVNKT